MAKQTVIRPVKGTRDFYPEVMAIRTYLYRVMRRVSESFGYSEYEGPILETFELYAAKSGEEIVEKQSYVFEDRGGDKLTLRPELTPTLARMVAARQGQLTFPLRWWSFGPFWRYERPQKGRTREFFQWNIDMIGDPSPEADAELIAIAATFIKEVGLTINQAQVLVNDRRLMDRETLALGIGEDLRKDVYQFIDRKGKLKPDAWREDGLEIGLTDKQIDGIEALIANNDLWKKSAELTRIFELIEAYGLSDYVRFAPEVIRGLAYYTGTVFEAWDTAGDFRAIFGGGRYDNLVGDVGGQPVGGVGFAAGDLVIRLLLEQTGLLPEAGRTPAEIIITAFDQDTLTASLELGQFLRENGLRVSNFLHGEKLGKQFKYADRTGAKIALILGPEEIKSGTTAVKDLLSGEQETIPRAKLVHHLKQLLEA